MYKIYYQIDIDINIILLASGIGITCVSNVTYSEIYAEKYSLYVCQNYT